MRTIQKSESFVSIFKPAAGLSLAILIGSGWIAPKLGIKFSELETIVAAGSGIAAVLLFMVLPRED